MPCQPRSGSLDQTPLPRLMVQVHLDRLTGHLQVQGGRVTRRIAFLDGAPIGLESNRESDGLLEQLREREIMSSEDVERVRQHAKRRRSSAVAAVLELGLLGPKDLLLALRERTRHALLDCFAWSTGTFSIEPAASDACEAQALRGDLLRWVCDGLETHWGTERLYAALATRLPAYPGLTRDSRVVRWMRKDEVGERLIRALDGTRTLDAAMREAASPVVLSLAWLLDTAEALDYSDEPRSEPEESDEREPAAEATEDVEIVIESRGAGGATGADTPTSSGGDESGVRPAATSPRAEALRKEVGEKFERLAELDHYELLGVEHDASPSDIKRAYFTAAKRFHPDALARLALDDLKAAANEVFARITKAHQVLSDPEERRDYDASLDGEGELDGTRLVQAETLYRKGEVLLRAGNFRGAIEFLRPAAELWPMDAVYQASLGWALHRQSPPDTEKARECLERAVSLDPRLAQAHLWLGTVLKDAGETEVSARHLARAKQLDPNVR